jgi:hypothetical protein
MLYIFQYSDSNPHNKRKCNFGDDKNRFDHIGINTSNER